MVDPVVVEEVRRESVVFANVSICGRIKDAEEVIVVQKGVFFVGFRRRSR